MQTKTRAAGAASFIAIAVATAVAPVGHAAGSTGPQGLSREVRQCIAPILTGPHSPDVVQGWIDGCRRDVRAAHRS